MSTPPRLFLRVDATPDTGLGHFMRCLALAEAWLDTAGPVTFIGRAMGRLEHELEARGIARAEVEYTYPDTRDIEITETRVPRGAPVVLDGYHFDLAFAERLSQDRCLLVIDDTGHQPAYAGSVLLNPNVDADRVAYGNAPELRLLGPRYALIRKAVREARERAAARTGGSISRVLVTLGGADRANDTLKTLTALAASATRTAVIRAVLGPLNPHAPSLEAFAREHSGIEVAHQPLDMLAQFLWADLVVASAGSVSAELAALGVPAILLAVADNQLPVGRAMHREGAATFAGDIRAFDAAGLTRAVDAAMLDAPRQAAMRTLGPLLVDGKGPLRVCAALKEAMSD